MQPRFEPCLLSTHIQPLEFMDYRDANVSDVDELHAALLEMLLFDLADPVFV